MAITKQKKQDILSKLDSAFKEATSVVFVGFDKLTVAHATEVRKSLKDDGVKYMVAKKTLITRALVEQGWQGDVPELPGKTAIAWSAGDDETVAARDIYNFGKKLKGAISISGGVFAGEIVDKEKMMGIATIPPLPVLRGMFVNVINSPIQGMVIALDQVAKKKT